jgi:hypothetical protein
MSETYGVALDSIALKYHNQFGIAYGSTIGNGLSYRRWLNDRYALQITGAYLSFTTNYRGLVSGYYKGWVNNTGLALLYAIQKWKTVRTLAYFGASFNSRGTIYNEYVVVDSARYPYFPWSADNYIREVLTAGNGLGIDCYLWRFGLNVMTGLHYGYDPRRKRFIPPSLSLEGGLFFCW